MGCGCTATDKAETQNLKFLPAATDKLNTSMLSAKGSEKDDFHNSSFTKDAFTTKGRDSELGSLKD